MKLVYVANARIPSEKANAYQILQMCQALAEVGLEVELVYPRRRPFASEGEIEKYYGFIPRFRLTARPCLDLQPEASRFGSLSLPYQLAFLIQSWTFVRSVTSYLGQSGADVFYSRDLYSLRALMGSKKQNRRRFFYEAHSVPKRPWGRWLARSVLQRIAGIVVLTGYLKERYIALGISPERILVAPDGVDLRRFQIEGSPQEIRSMLGLPRDQKIIGYVGRFHTMGMEKGMTELIRAFALTNSHRINSALCLVGGPEVWMPRFVDQAQRAGVDPGRIIMVKTVPPAQIPLYLRALDVCVMPSPANEFFSYYTSPLKLFEYMAAGRAIVATDLPSIREILQHGRNAILVRPGDPHALAEGILTLLENPELAQRISQQAARDVVQYSWENRAKRILSFVKEPS